MSAMMAAPFRGHSPDRTPLSCRHLRLRECTAASIRPAELGSVIATAGQALLPAVADGRVRLPIDTTLAFDTAARAAERLRSHRAQGKVVLTVP
ncbi:zinc-binding dehydrogenase [Streptomyces laculatispora]|uniref:zinc-binding dehydrogenase n=1 Tax=Streptomyces laculatispora TaxID=887464 RepID=UPI001A944BB5|nr:zinc-binding dehydrogenase [Streptomyces laculatispora]MBO0916807.1 zinc-binding dehydrogenase [Streptomyces laculatispora]